MDMTDVRKALYRAYAKQAAQPGGIEGKSSEAWCALVYPTWWDAKDADDFCEPCGIEVYSYALGPSRNHYIQRAETESHPNYYTWRGPDIFATAVRVIDSWAEEVGESGE